MDFNLTEGQRMLQKVVREFVEREIEPIAAEIDKTGVFPSETFQKMTDLGLTGISIPEEYGGCGGTDVDKVIVVSEIARKCAASAAILSIHSIFPQVLLHFGSEEQKRKFIPPAVRGGCLGAFALTEPDAGSDAGAAKTTAMLDEETGEYVLNGTKCFISGGSQADVVLVFALTDPKKGLKGMSCILVEKGTPGFGVGKVEEKMGIHASETAELIFDNCRVPKENLVGKEGKGFGIAMSALDGARIGVGAQALGLAEEALELAVKYAKERVQFGKPIAKLQGIQWYIADMATKTEAALALKEEEEARVTVLSMGPPQAKAALKEALAMGADEAWLVSDRAFGGSDTWATATIMAAAIEKTGPYDAIFCGRQAIDGDTAQVGPEIAEFLGIPQITYVKEIKMAPGGFEVIRHTETGSYRMAVKGPVLFTAIKELNQPRYPKISSIFKYYDGEDVIGTLSLDDLDIDHTQIGLKGSPTNVFRSFVPIKEKHTEMMEGLNGKEKAVMLVDKLSSLKLI